MESQGLYPLKIDRKGIEMIHVAGLHFCIEGRLLQRCLICGYKLIDVRLDSIGVAVIDGRVNNAIPTYAATHCIRVEGTNPLVFTDLGSCNGCAATIDGGWSELCIHMMEES